MEYTLYIPSPAGTVEIKADDRYVTSIRLIRSADGTATENDIDRLPPHVRQCVAELQEYFAGTRTRFTVPVKQSGTDFQQKVWRQLLEIPYGTTVSYGEIARRLGSVKLSRAVGGANHRNRLWIVVPCHRVIGADGSLTGYGGGIDCKQWLLQHEAGADSAKTVQR
jgi:methylated-DNA-[protein]-cysteine S-methyltransferase